MHRQHEVLFPAGILYSFFLIAIGFLLTPGEIFSGLLKIITMQDLLITDYMESAGIGAAFVNSGLVTLISVVLLRLCNEPYNGFTIVTYGLMSGFAFFGKNIINIWPILLGTFLYSKYQKETFGKHLNVGLLATALSPAVSYMAFGSNHKNLFAALLLGIMIGFLLPMLSPYTYKIQNGMNLYNMGFACGLLAMMIVPIMTALGDKPESQMYWATRYTSNLAIIVLVLCVSLIILGFFACHRPPWAVWAGYRRLLTTTGRAPNDYLRMFGLGATLVNAGVNGLVALIYILLIGGDLNGATLGGILTVIGFGAYGKHMRNIIPIMVGVLLGGLSMHYSPIYPSLQLAALFGTTLAPISGHFGLPFGVLAGFIHSCLVLQTGGPVAGLNLYNNGYSGGLIATVMYPVLTAMLKHRNPNLRDENLYDMLEGDMPIDVSSWRTHKYEKQNYPEE